MRREGEEEGSYTGGRGMRRCGGGSGCPGMEGGHRDLWFGDVEGGGSGENGGRGVGEGGWEGLIFFTEPSCCDETDGWIHIRPGPVTVTVK
jgi:hypothetical protein